jgi:hypothetical protein
MPDNQFTRDFSGRLTFEMFRVPIEDYPAVCHAVVAEFHLAQHDQLVTNLCDFFCWDYHRGEQVVSFAWDNWTGFMVIANAPISEPLVRDIGDWLLQSQWAGPSPSSR